MDMALNSKSTVFQKKLLASFVSVLMSQTVFALQEISDEKLSETTGEGIAILPTEFSFVFRGDKTGNETSLTDRTKDTGYIHILPVGGLTSQVQDTNKDGKVDTNDHSVGKADLYLYGLALSKNNNDSNNRFGSKIQSWGTADNPWIFKAVTANNVPSFSDTSGTVTYLNLEAPLYETTIPTDSAKGADAYNLKLGLWADAFVRDQSKPDNDPDQFKLGEKFSTSQTTAEANAGGRANRLRLQGIWNGFSVNGSNLQMFQTLNGATNSNGMSSFYNNTLGLAGVLRFNSGKGTVASDNNVLRLSTQECGSGNTNGCATGTPQGLLDSPGLSGSSATAPNFSPNEGLFIYNLNTNLVLGSLYQPLILGSDGTNFSLEIARIPNNVNVYSKIYTRYAGDVGDPKVTYYGSTCNIYQCGSENITGYQGGSARNDYGNLDAKTTLPTHSSISIGSVTQGADNLLTPDKSATAMGISFGKSGTTGATNLGSGVIDGLLIQHMKFTTKGL